MYLVKKEYFNNSWIIKTIRVWDVDSIREMCIKCKFYTRGNGRDYQELFDFVIENAPTTPAMFWVARNIYIHSEIEDDITLNEQMEHIFFCLENYAITTSYSVKMRCEDDN